jgi:hypothetical protein
VGSVLEEMVGVVCEWMGQPLEQQWAQCEACSKWRKLALGADGWEGVFECRMIDWNPMEANCGAAEEQEEEVSVSSAGAQRVRASLSGDLSYYSLIRQAIISLKDRGGSSRQAINKVVKASKEASGGIFKSGIFNKALSTAGTGGTSAFK